MLKPMVGHLLEIHKSSYKVIHFVIFHIMVLQVYDLTLKLVEEASLSFSIIFFIFLYLCFSKHRKIVRVTIHI
jgi:hypothetical protein